MQDLLSHRWLVVFVALFSIWAASLIVVPYGVPWVAAGLLGLGLPCALWVKIRAPLSMRQVVQGVEAERSPRPALGASATLMSLSIASSILLAGAAFAGAPEPGANLAACRDGLPSCRRTSLTLTEITEVTLAARARNFSICLGGLHPCDARALSDAQVIAVAVAKYDYNASNCRTGLAPCNPALLPPPASRDLRVLDRQGRARNLSDCLEGRSQCDPSLLDLAEARTVARAEHARNYTACLTRLDSCDRRGLTPAEAASILPEPR
jgi:hypothetical protein